MYVILHIMWYTLSISLITDALASEGYKKMKASTFENLIIDSRTINYKSSRVMSAVTFDLYGKQEYKNGVKVGAPSSCGWVECLIEFDDYDVIIPAHVMGFIIKSGYGVKLFEFFKFNSGSDARLFYGGGLRHALECTYGSKPFDVLTVSDAGRKLYVMGLTFVDDLFSYLDIPF